MAVLPSAGWVTTRGGGGMADNEVNICAIDTSVGQLRAALADNRCADSAPRAAVHEVLVDLESAATQAKGRVLEPPVRPPMPPVVFLRGAGIDGSTFDRLHGALWAHGLWTLTDRTRAMHLSRGGLPVWMLDFSAHTTGAPISIAEVAARYVDAPSGRQLQFKRVHSHHHFERPLRAGELDIEAVAGRVAAVIRNRTA